MKIELEVPDGTPYHGLVAALGRKWSEIHGVTLCPTCGRGGRHAPSRRDREAKEATARRRVEREALLGRLCRDILAANPSIGKRAFRSEVRGQFAEQVGRGVSSERLDRIYDEITTATAAA